MDQREFIQWIAFSQMEPFGAHIEDYRAGRLLAALSKSNQPWFYYYPGYDDADVEKNMTHIRQIAAETQITQVKAALAYNEGIEE
ncbi:MAG: hypothetical protein K2X93_06730 [Candidatus Obscuribacterales bacterium]|nr:hypothetical protein [Candidatus Obscuribacterales bacterium]